ncbi:MAG: glycosyltransferase family 4 protein [Chloroflexota bacterium]
MATTFPPYIGGVETHTHELVSRLADAWRITVLTTDPAGELPPQERRPDGVTIVRIPAFPRTGDLYFAPRLPGAIGHGSWDLVHFQGSHTLVPPLGMLAASRAGLPYVVSLHTGGNVSAMQRLIRGPQRLVLRPLLRHARRIIAVSPFERDEAAVNFRLSRDRFEVIPNGSDLPAPKPRAPNAPTSLIVTVGRLERYKGHHRVLAAMPHVLARQPGARLAIFGSGREEAALRRQAADLGVTDRVTIERIDPADRQAMADQLGSAAVVAVLSEYESHGLAAVEAAALGRPLVVTDATALHDLARRGDARGVAPDATPAEVAAALLAEMETRPRRASRQPTWDDCATAVADLYRRVLGQAGS